MREYDPVKMTFVRIGFLVAILLVFAVGSFIVKQSKAASMTRQEGVELEIVDKSYDTRLVPIGDNIVTTISYMLSVKFDENVTTTVFCNKDAYDSVEIGQTAFFTIVFNKKGEIEEMILE